MRLLETANLGVHAAAILAAEPGRRLRTKELAARLEASEATLAKVMQRLASAGLVDSKRGPAGGFRLARPGREISLKEILEAVEGPMNPIRCLFGRMICGRDRCIFGDLAAKLDKIVSENFSKTRLSEVVIRLEAKAGPDTGKRSLERPPRG